jgi:hypothetical protein
MELYQLIDDVAETEEMYEYVMKCLNAMVKGNHQIKRWPSCFRVQNGYFPHPGLRLQGPTGTDGKVQITILAKTATTLIGKINSLPQGF